MEDQYTEPEEKFDENGEDPEQDDAVEIYSKNAIRGFSIFFSTIFGGALLYQNLKNAGYKKASYTVLGFSVAYTLLTIILSNFIPRTPGSPFALVCNLIGGLILSEYFFPKYFPENDYYPKPIWNALGISILICVILFTFIYYTGGLPELTKK